MQTHFVGVIVSTICKFCSFPYFSNPLNIYFLPKNSQMNDSDSVAIIKQIIKTTPRAFAD